MFSNISDKLSNIMKVLTLCFIFLSASFSSAASEGNLHTAGEFNEILKRHQSAGQLGPQELKKQRYQFKKDKTWQSNFSEQVRGVAAKLSSPREIIQLKNPSIEISVK